MELPLEARIGPSTLCLKGIPLDEAIDRVRDAGLTAFELTPITYGGPERFDENRCDDLRRRLEGFGTTTVHSSGLGNICNEDSDLRERAKSGYFGLLRVAKGVGADVVTFHPGRGDSEPGTAEVNIAFGKELVEAAEDSGVRLGYELFDRRIGEEIGADFGVLFDVGHASRRGSEVTTDDVLGMIDELSNQTVQYHVHGVGDPEKTDHLPFSENTWLEYDRIIDRVEAQRYQGPVILEIGIRDQDWQRNLEDCVSAKESLLGRTRAS